MSNPTLIKSREATADADPYTIVKPSAGKAAPAAAATDFLLGALDAQGASQGSMCDIVQGGYGEVKLGGTVADGAPITADASALGISAPAASTSWIIGFARAAGVAGDVIPYEHAPGQVTLA